MCIVEIESDFLLLTYRVQSMTRYIGKDHRDKIEVPDPLAVENE